MPVPATELYLEECAKRGDLGVVDHIVVPEWRHLVANETDKPEAIRVIEVPRIQRICRQRALFLEMLFAAAPGYVVWPKGRSCTAEIAPIYP